MMTKLEAIVQPGRFEAVKKALIDTGIDGMTVSEVRGHGRQKGHTETYHGHEYSVDLLPKIKIEIVMDDKLVDSVVESIIKNAATGKIGDGKIFISKVEKQSASATRSVAWRRFELFLTDTMEARTCRCTGGLCGQGSSFPDRHS